MEKIDLTKYPEGAVVKTNAKGIQYVELPGPTKEYVEKMRQENRCTGRIYFKKKIMHG